MNTPSPDEIAASDQILDDIAAGRPVTPPDALIAHLIAWRAHMLADLPPLHAAAPPNDAAVPPALTTRTD